MTTQSEAHHLVGPPAAVDSGWRGCRVTAVWADPPRSGLLSGAEVIEGTSATVRDFWSWSSSDLRTNTVRSRFAEFLVAQALHATDRPRVEWDGWDVTTVQGRIEVKSSAYVQAWAQQRPSSIRFTGLRSRLWTAEGGRSSDVTYNADAYVFALLADPDHASYDALDTSHWQFWVLPRAEVVEHDCESIGLPTLRRLAGESVSYSQLATVIVRVLGSTRPVEP